MSTINVNCVDQVMDFTNMPVIASGDINADKIHFTFDSVWNGYNKICTFYQNPGHFYWALVDSNNDAVIPSGVMNKPGKVHFGVSGWKDNTQRTSNILTYDIVEGAYTEVDETEATNLITVINGKIEDLQDEIENMQDKYDDTVGSLAHVRIEDDNEFEYDEDYITRLQNFLNVKDISNKLTFDQSHGTVTGKAYKMGNLILLDIVHEGSYTGNITGTLTGYKVVTSAVIFKETNADITVTPNSNGNTSISFTHINHGTGVFLIESEAI